MTNMYSVIICPECEHPQIVKDDPETTTCQRCQKTLKFRKLKRFFNSDGIEQARHARASIAAQQKGVGEEFDELDLDFDSDATSERIEDELLSAHGLDKGELRNQTSQSNSSSRSRPDIIRDAVRESDPATEDAVREYAEEHGVPGDKAVDLLKKMYERGEARCSGGEYRLL